MRLFRRRELSPGAAAVARPGIAVGGSQGPRAKDGTRFPEAARLSAQAGVRRALAQLHEETDR